MTIPLSEIDRNNKAYAHMTDDEFQNYITPTRWYIPEEILEQGYQFQTVLGPGQIVVLPAKEQEWRDSAHYKAYGRPTKTEEEEH